MSILNTEGLVVLERDVSCLLSEVLLLNEPAPPSNPAKVLKATPTDESPFICIGLFNKISALG